MGLVCSTSRWRAVQEAQSEEEWPMKEGFENGREDSRRGRGRLRKGFSLRRCSSRSSQPVVSTHLDSRSSSESSPSPSGPLDGDCNSPLARTISDILLWRRPMTTLLAILCGTLVYYHVVYRLRSLVSLVADVLLVLACATVVLYHFSSVFATSLKLELLRDWDLSTESANCIAAFGANTLGAAEAVFRVAASGSDYKLFVKVMIVLYATSVVGRLISGPTFIFVCMWLIFTIPVLISWVRPDADICLRRSNDNDNPSLSSLSPLPRR